MKPTARIVDTLGNVSVIEYENDHAGRRFLHGIYVRMDFVPGPRRYRVQIDDVVWNREGSSLPYERRTFVGRGASIEDAIEKARKRALINGVGPTWQLDIALGNAALEAAEALETLYNSR